MKHAVCIAAGTARSEIGRLAALYDPAEADGIRQDAALRTLLAGIDIADLVEVVDGLKTAEGDGRAIALYRAWLAVSDHKVRQVFAAWYNLGVQLSASGEAAAAATAFETALAARPTLTAAAINAGLCHETLKDPDGALQIWQTALQPDEDRTALLNHRGRLLEQLKRYDEAENSLRASLLTDPNQPDAVHHWTGIRAKTCSWPVFQDLPGLDRNALLDACGALTRLAIADDLTLNHRANAEWMARKFPPAQPRLSPASGYAHRKLRIGYMSSDYCMHPMAYLVADLFEQHDREAVTVYGYCSTKEDGSDVRRRVLASFDQVRPILAMSDEEVARTIRADEIDILVDLNGLTLGTRLPVLRWRPAPVQVTYLGYNGPIPLDELDYIIADRLVIPPEIADTHRPKPLYLPRCFQANDRHLPVAPRGTRAEAGLPDGAFVFCCFSNTYKITEEIFDAWTAILRRTDNTVFWLYIDNEPARRNLARRFAESGLDPDRLRFAERTSPDHYRGRLALADLFLDTFPYNAGTTASDALRVGLPLVTLTGRSFVSRMAASLLEAVGLAEGITGTLDAYVDLAVALATDPDRYRAFRAPLDGDAWARTLGDTPAFARDLEAAFKAVAAAPTRDLPIAGLPARLQSPNLRTALEPQCADTDRSGADFDGLTGDVVFCAWTGATAMSPQRAECLLSIYRETHCPVILLTPANLADWIVAGSRFHPAFPLLSDVHRADYIRCYMMHHHGGGYTDIKRTSVSWRQHFARLRATPEGLGLGYQEIGPHGIPHVAGPLGDELRANFREVIGNCAYIFRKGSDLTRRWLEQTHHVLDSKLSLLQQHPAQHPMDQTGIILPDGSTSSYPLRWAELLGEIFHPLVYEYRARLLQADIAPQFIDYR